MPRPGEEPRAAVEQAIGLRFKHFGDFIEELASNLSTGGMFIRTRKPHPVGSIFEFEFRLDNDQPLIAGKAQVAWVRRRSDYIDKPAGMGVRFVELDDDSRRHIGELVAAHEEKGGQPPDIEPVPEAQAAATEPPSSEPPPTAAPAPPTATSAPHAGTPSVAEEEKRRGARLLWALVAVFLAAILVFLWLRQAPQSAPPTESVAVGSKAVASASSVPELSATDSNAVPDTVEPPQILLVNDWARAWSDQRVDDYLAAYSSRFEVTGGLDRKSWQGQRRVRILAPQWIEVGLAFVELEEAGPDTARVSFVQAYESDSYRDVVRKVLDLAREEDGWRILRETVEP